MCLKHLLKMVTFLDFLPRPFPRGSSGVDATCWPQSCIAASTQTCCTCKSLSMTKWMENAPFQTFFRWTPGHMRCLVYTSTVFSSNELISNFLIRFIKITIRDYSTVCSDRLPWKHPILVRKLQDVHTPTVLMVTALLLNPSKAVSIKYGLWNFLV